MKNRLLITLAVAGVLSFTNARAQKMKTEIPPEITTPDSVETSLGTLRFSDGLPDKATVEKVYDNLDRMRARGCVPQHVVCGFHPGQHRGPEERGLRQLLRGHPREPRGRQDIAAAQK